MNEWKEVFTAASSLDDVDAACDDHVRRCLDDLRAQLVGDSDLTADERAAVLARAEPTIRQRTQAVFVAAWQRLRLEAEMSSTVQ